MIAIGVRGLFRLEKVRLDIDGIFTVHYSAILRTPMPGLHALEHP